MSSSKDIPCNVCGNGISFTGLWYYGICSVCRPSTSLKLLGLPSAKTSLDTYFIEKASICSRIGSTDFPFSVTKYSTLTGIPGLTFLSIRSFSNISLRRTARVFGLIPSIVSNWLNLVCPKIIILRKIWIVNFLPIKLNVQSTGQRVVIETNFCASFWFNLNPLLDPNIIQNQVHLRFIPLLTDLSLTNLYTYLFIVKEERKVNWDLEVNLKLCLSY